MSDFNTQVIEEFRANAGKVGGMFADASLLLLHTRGRKSGKSYTSPLVHFDDNGRLLIVGSKGGADEHPEWYLNLLANPDVSIEIGTETKDVHATDLDGEERNRAWQDIVRQAPGFGDYQKKTSRTIPVVALTSN